MRASTSGSPPRRVLYAVQRWALAGLIGLALMPSAGVAQDSHYWNRQYGNRARLLGGTVIGSSDDLASVFYNPGALALVEDPQFVLTGNVVEYTRFSLTQPAEEVQSIGSTSLAGTPALFAGELRLKFLKDSRLAYSFLTRFSSQPRIKERFTLAADDLPAFPEFAGLTADLELDQGMSEYWAGLTWSIPLSPHIGLGISPFVTIRNQKGRTQLTAQGSGSFGDGILVFGDDFSFEDWRLLAKIGLAVVKDPWSAGVTLTTPSVHLWGDGSSRVDRSLVTSDGPSRILTGFDDGIAVDHHSPFAIGAGFGYTMGRFTLHTSAEYFTRISERVVFDGAEVSTPAFPDTLSTDLIQQADDVLNFGVGAEYGFSDRVAAFGSFRTDFSSTEQGSPENIGFTRFNIYHVAGGLDFPVDLSHFTLGVVYSWGRSFGEGLDPLTSLRDRVRLPDDATIDYRRLTAILGFTFVLE